MVICRPFPSPKRSGGWLIKFVKTLISIFALIPSVLSVLSAIHFIRIGKTSKGDSGIIDP